MSTNYLVHRTEFYAWCDSEITDDPSKISELLFSWVDDRRAFEVHRPFERRAACMLKSYRNAEYAHRKSITNGTGIDLELQMKRDNNALRNINIKDIVDVMWAGFMLEYRTDGLGK